MALNIEKIIENNTKDGVIDFKAVDSEVDNNYVNDIIKKNNESITKKLTTELAEKNEKDTLIALGLNDMTLEQALLKVTQLGGNETETGIKLQNAIKERDDYKDQVTELSPYKTRAADIENKMLLVSDGFLDPVTQAGIHSVVSSNVTEEKDYETAYGEFKSDEANKHHYSKQSNGPTSTGSTINNQGGRTQSGLLKIMEEKYGIKLE